LFVIGGAVCGRTGGGDASPGNSSAPSERSFITMLTALSTDRPLSSSTERSCVLPSMRDSRKYSSGPTPALSGSKPGLTRSFWFVDPIPAISAGIPLTASAYHAPAAPP
jgi:hypothetical protein